MIHLYEVTCMGDLVGHYHAPDAEMAKLEAHEDTSLPMEMLEAEEIKDQ